MGSKTLFNAVFIRPEQVVRFLLCSLWFNARSACDASMFTSCRKIYILHDVNIDASQADRALNWTGRINKVVDRVTQE